MASTFRHWPRILILLPLRLSFWLSLWLMGLFLLLLGLVLSPWGFGWLAEQGAQRGFFSLEQISGSPLDEFKLSGFAMHNGLADIRIGRLELSWSDDCLLDGKLCLDGLLIEGVDVQLKPSTSAGEGKSQETQHDEAAKRIFSPIPIELRALVLRDVSIQLADDTQLHWQQFTSGARFRGGTITLLPTRLHGVQVKLPPEPSPAPADNILTASSIDSAIALHQTQDVQGHPPITTEATSLAERQPLTLPTIQLPVSFIVPRLLIDEFQLEGPTPYTVNRLLLSLSGGGHDIRLHHLSLSTPDIDAELIANISLRDDYPLDVELDAHILRAPVNGQELHLELHGSIADLEISSVARGPITARLQGQVDGLAPTLPFKLSLETQRVDWPLQPIGAGPADNLPSDMAEHYSVRDLTLLAEGDLQRYTTALKATLSGSALPDEVQAAMTGEGDLEHFVWKPLTLAAGQGAIISRGEVRWTPNLDVNATVRLDDFSLDAVTEVVKGQLSGDAQLHFAQHETDWEVAIPQLAISGSLQDRPLNLNAQLSGNSDMHWWIDHLELHQGDNQLHARGQIEETIDLSGELNAPALDTLLPELAGSAEGHFLLEGTFDAPRLAMQLTGERLRFAEYALSELQLDANIAGLEDPSLDIALSAGGMESAEQRFSHLGLSLAGRLSEHRLEFSADADYGMPLSRAALALEGGLNAKRDQYHGRLISLGIDSQQADLRLDRLMAFEVSLTSKSADISPFCLSRQRGGQLCVTQPIQASAEQGQVNLALREFPMDLLALSLPDAWDAEGRTDAQLQARWAPGGQWSLQADAESRLALSGRDAYGNPWRLPDSTLGIDLDADHRQAQAQARLSLAEAGRLQLDLHVNDPTGAAVLQGRLQAEDIQLAPYHTLVTGLQQLEGALNGDITMGGSLSAPRLDGNLVLEDLRARGDEAPIEASDGRLAIALQGNTATLEGFIAAEQGHLEFQGNAGWPSLDNWHANLSIDGRETPVMVALPQFGRIHVAPSLEVTINPELLRLRGQVRVPWGRLTASEAPPSAISPSSDEVIISRQEDARMRGEAQQALQSQALNDAGMRLDLRIEVILGPDVQLEAYGLESELVGNLEVRQEDGPLQLYGDVNLEEGRYRAFGQDLIIRKGQVLFSGPATQPRLQFDAIRNPDTTEDNVIAGLRVTGSAEQPSLRIFSEPAMDESHALSYLLRGRAPDDSDSDGALTSALIGLSLSRTGGAVGQLGQVFGIDDLSLDTAGSGDESQVVVSGYLFEDLKVSYGVGIFSPIAELTLRYRLLQDLYLEAVSGAAQAVDLIYTFSLGRSRASS